MEKQLIIIPFIMTLINVVMNNSNEKRMEFKLQKAKIMDINK